ncbi:polymorphic toxin-type HINT domain-containing protein, partial [Streptomyces anandii]|uniref:polymorphic toxin-type HINT domain-containing protein n=1 Tax=Streptomyces anandii TaxID=285454 RepID=UPI0036F892D5
TTPDGPRKLTATYEHPFWSPSAHQWTKAHDLTPGTTLLSTNGTTVRVQANHPFDQHTRTYNLTVDELHTYYVLAGRTPVLVHNSVCEDVELGPGISSADSLTSFTSPKPETEYVFDPVTGKFLAGDRDPIPGGLSPHEQLVEKMGVDSKKMVGGTLYRDSEGELVFTQESGHYGHKWTPDVWDQFKKLMESYGVRAEYESWG